MRMAWTGGSIGGARLQLYHSYRTVAIVGAIPIVIGSAILATLQRDGRIANVDLADAISLSPSACLRRVKALEASGVIEGYRAEVSRVKAGLGLTAFIGLRVEGHSRAMSQQIEQGLTAIPAVVGCHVTSGGDDFMVEVAAQDLADYERVLLDQILAVPGVRPSPALARLISAR